MELSFNGALITSITVCNEIGQQEIEAAIVEFSTGNIDVLVKLNF